MRLREWVKGVGTAEAARRFGAVESGVRHWVGGQRPVPPDRVIPIAEATGWEVTPHELRPDLYPYPDDGLPLDRRDHCKDSAA